MTRSGTRSRIGAADIGPHSTACSVMNSRQPDRDGLGLRPVKISASTNSFQISRKQNVPATASAGRISGNVMSRKICHRLAPSMSAASSMLAGSPWRSRRAARSPAARSAAGRRKSCRNRNRSGRYWSRDVIGDDDRDRRQHPEIQDPHQHRILARNSNRVIP